MSLFFFFPSWVSISEVQEYQRIWRDQILSLEVFNEYGKRAISCAGRSCINSLYKLESGQQTNLKFDKG